MSYVRDNVRGQHIIVKYLKFQQDDAELEPYWKGLFPKNYLLAIQHYPYLLHGFIEYSVLIGQLQSSTVY